MEEDIKVIKKQIYTEDGKKMNYIDIDNVIDNECDNFIKAIENLIKGYKDLEEKRKTTIKVIGANYIHKDKVREKIEDIEWEIKKCPEDDQRYRLVLIGKRNSLLELLQEGDDK